jgi:amidase
MLVNEFIALDAVGLGNLVESGAVSAVEVLDAALMRISECNPGLNAIAYEAFAKARVEAANAHHVGTGRPFCGVPMLIKDLGLSVAGWPRRSGSRFIGENPATSDCGLVGRYRASGALLIGTTTTSEFGILGTVETQANGPTRNPWNLAHTAGGSSGGAAAAVASGMVPIAHASDGLGSIRIPAACCGLIGLKPTRDRVPNWPDRGEYSTGLVCDHVLTRTVRDSATMLDMTCMPVAAVPGSPWPPATRYSEEIERSPGCLRIRWSSDRHDGKPIDPEVADALRTVAGILEKLRHEVRETPLTADYDAFERARLPLTATDFAASMIETIDLEGRQPVRGDLEPFTYLALQSARGMPAEAGMYGLRKLRTLAGRLLEDFEMFDVFMSPVMTTPAPVLGYLNGTDVTPAMILEHQSDIFPYTALFNYTGQPSLSLPLCRSRSGLPIGIMFTARYGDEATLFRLAGQLEKEMPWQKMPR